MADEPSRWFFSKSDAAELFGCTVRNIEKLLQEKHIEATKGRVDIRTLCVLMRQRKAKADEEGESAGHALKREEARYRKLKADIAELELKVKNGEAIETDLVVANFSRAMATLREALQELEKRLPEECQGQEARAIATILGGEVQRLTENFYGLMVTPLPDDWKDRYLSALVQKERPDDSNAA